MDPWRQQILADIGISTWVRRDQLPSLDLVEPGAVAVEPRAPVATKSASQRVPAAPPAARSIGSGAGNALAALAESLDSGAPKAPTRSAPEVEPVPTRSPSSQAVRYPEVACLWSGDAALFCVPAELQGQVRLAKDILATAANDWSLPTEQVVFRWAELQASGFAAADADRALLAFAEKRIEVATARWVLCTPYLQPLLAQLALPQATQLLGLSELATLARSADLKQKLWYALHGASPEPSAHA